jgi:hypothetical protein
MDRTKLNLGFFLLKNPAPAELLRGILHMQDSERSMFFSPANHGEALNSTHHALELENLRVFLQDLLDSHIERELPKV